MPAASAITIRSRVAVEAGCVVRSPRAAAWERGRPRRRQLHHRVRRGRDERLALGARCRDAVDHRLFAQRGPPVPRDRKAVRHDDQETSVVEQAKLGPEELRVLLRLLVEDGDGAEVVAAADQCDPDRVSAYLRLANGGDELVRVRRRDAVVGRDEGRPRRADSRSRDRRRRERPQRRRVRQAPTGERHALYPRTDLARSRQRRPQRNRRQSARSARASRARIVIPLPCRRAGRRTARGRAA